MHGPLSQHSMVYTLVSNACGNLADQPEDALARSLNYLFTRSFTYALIHVFYTGLAQGFSVHSGERFPVCMSP